MNDSDNRREESGRDDESPAPSGPGSRREFLRSTAAGILSITLAGPDLSFGKAEQALLDGEGEASTFRSRWPGDVERYWAGPEYWAAPLQHWRISNGRLELIGSGADQKVHLLTRDVASGTGTLEMRVHVGFVSRQSGDGEAGFEVGIKGPLNEYRNNVVHGRGLKAGLRSGGQLFIEGGEEAELAPAFAGEASLHLSVAPGSGGHVLTLAAREPGTGVEIGSVRRSGLSAEDLRGNLALIAGSAEGATESWGTPRLWFRDFRVDGSSLAVHEERALGPVLFTQYTLSRGVLKMTAQMPPVGRDEERTVLLQIRDGASWKGAAESSIDELARTATFRIADWDATSDVSYRLVYRLRQNDGIETHAYEGTIRQEPVEQRELVVGVLSCATDPIFPNLQVAAGLAYHDPDLLAFTGDQFYESSGGYGVQRRRDNVPLSTLDYLRKWYLHGWSFGELMRDRPTICMPDDHDVFQGNIWGAGGRAAETYEMHNDGGYFMPAEWINMVQRTQTAHLPDPFESTPVEQGITVYYTDMLYGRVSFAVLEDRKWKSGPDGLVPPGSGRVDHITDPDLDPRVLDVPGAELLGERQLRFLDEWGTDWRGADLKVIVSQTAFAQVPNLHGYDLMPLVADLDSNGWPQTPRNEALRRFRKGYAFQVGGDQHLPMILHYGVDEFDDAGYIFCVPAVATGYPRQFDPSVPGSNRPPGAASYVGQFFDGLGNRFTLHALANPRLEQRDDVLAFSAAKASGYGMLRIDKQERTFTMEAWPILSDPARDDQQFPGWPKTVGLEDNYGRAAAAFLPEIIFDNVVDPIVQVVDEDDDEVVYTLRIRGSRFQPKVFREGSYTVRIGDDSGWVRTLVHLDASAQRGGEPLHVRV